MKNPEKVRGRRIDEVLHEAEKLVSRPTLPGDEYTPLELVINEVRAGVNKDTCLNGEQVGILANSMIAAAGAAKGSLIDFLLDRSPLNKLRRHIPPIVTMTNGFRLDCANCLREDCGMRKSDTGDR